MARFGTEPPVMPEPIGGWGNDVGFVSKEAAEQTGWPAFRTGVSEGNEASTVLPGVRPNKYAGVCPNCEQRVEPEQGRLDRIEGKWVTSHVVCPAKDEKWTFVKPGNWPEPATPLPFTVAEGRYTVEFEDGSYKTLRVKRQRDDADFKPGKILLSHLVGQDNDTDYQSFAHVNDQGQVVVWAKHIGNQTLLDAVQVLIGDIDAARTAYAIRSGNCSRCGRTLTVPSSLFMGLGPECSKKAI